MTTNLQRSLNLRKSIHEYNELVGYDRIATSAFARLAIDTKFTLEFWDDDGEEMDWDTEPLEYFDAIRLVQEMTWTAQRVMKGEVQRG